MLLVPQLLIASFQRLVPYANSFDQLVFASFIVSFEKLVSAFSLIFKARFLRRNIKFLIGIVFSSIKTFIILKVDDSG